ncbi:YceD family protein [Hyphococcus sp.]|uniref:YceD family protein n=1 Tax=Hyphococcus sp. TaxID=2038636 RepID=UPI00208B177D|nr:MAG: metal-binding protein [Marinicaulis sp.]
MTNPDQNSPEFSLEISLDDLGKKPKHYRLSANEHERKNISARLETPSVEKLEGEMEVRAMGAMIYVEGSLVASLTRECVASLELMDEQVTETFELEFTRAAPADEVDPFDLDAPEIIEGDTIDLGELLVQQLSLAMEPFPRKPDAQSLAEAYAPSENISPFAVLKGALGKSDDNQ